MEKDEYQQAWDESGNAGPAESAVEAAAKKSADDGKDEFIRAFSESDAKDEEEQKERERREAERRAAAKKVDE